MSALRPSRSARRWISALALVVGVLALEVVLRLAGVSATPLPESTGNNFRFTTDEVQLYEPLPGSVRHIRYPAIGSHPAHVVEHRVNAQGFRGPLVETPKPAGVFRVLCVGDSHTFGEGVREDETWPARLAEILAEDAPAVEVVNAGVGGYNLRQELRWIEGHVLEFEPDLLVLQYFVNDLGKRGELASLEPDDWIVQWSHPRRGGAIGAWRERVRTFDVLLDGVYRKRWLRSWAEQRARLHTSDRTQHWLEETLRDLRDLLDGRGCRLAVALFPLMVREGEHLASHAPFQHVVRVCGNAGVPCLDVEPAFAGKDVEALRVHPCDLHAGAEAHAIFARSVAEWLRASDLLGEGK